LTRNFKYDNIYNIHLKNNSRLFNQLIMLLEKVLAKDQNFHLIIFWRLNNDNVSNKTNQTQSELKNFN